MGRFFTISLEQIKLVKTYSDIFEVKEKLPLFLNFLKLKY